MHSVHSEVTLLKGDLPCKVTIAMRRICGLNQSAVGLFFEFRKLPSATMKVFKSYKGGEAFEPSMRGQLTVWNNHRCAD